MKWLQKPKTFIKQNVSNFTAASLATIISCSLYDHVLSPVDIYKTTSKSVVSISSMAITNDPFSPGNIIESVDGTGTGFSFISGTYIITNAHVVQDAMDIKISVSDGGDELRANIIDIDKKHDVAVLKLKNNKTLHPLKKCKNPVQVGQPVFAIGNPFGLNKSMTSGIISNVDRSLDDTNNTNTKFTNLIQTDAAINPGNSGGVLLDEKYGCIVGMNTAILSTSGASAGIGFAIPIDAVENIALDIINNNMPNNFILGVTLLPDKYSEVLGVRGLIIADVIPNSVADAIELHGTYRDKYGRPYIGDIIVGINNKPIMKKIDLVKILENIKLGDIVELEILRQDGIVKFEIVS